MGGGEYLTLRFQCRAALSFSKLLCCWTSLAAVTGSSICSRLPDCPQISSFRCKVSSKVDCLAFAPAKRTGKIILLHLRRSSLPSSSLLLDSLPLVLFLPTTAVRELIPLSTTFLRLKNLVIGCFRIEVRRRLKDYSSCK